MAETDGAHHDLHPATIRLRAPFGFRLRSYSWFLGRISAGLSQPFLSTFCCSKGLCLLVSNRNTNPPADRYAEVYIRSNIGAPEDWPPNFPSTIECPTPIELRYGRILNLYLELRKLQENQELIISIKPIDESNLDQIRYEFIDQNTNPPTLYLHQLASSCSEWPVLKDKLTLSIHLREFNHILNEKYFGTLTAPYNKVTLEQRDTVELELTQGYDDEKETQVYHLSILLPEETYELQTKESDASIEPLRLPLRMTFDLYSLRCLIDLAEELKFESLHLALDNHCPFQIVVGNARVYTLRYTFLNQPANN